MAAPTIRATAALASSGTTNQSSIAVAIPATAAVGDLLVLDVSTNYSGGGTAGVSAPGWTVAHHAQVGTSGKDFLTRICDGTEGGSVTVTETGTSPGSTRWKARVTAITTGTFNAASPLDSSSGATANSATAVTPFSCGTFTPSQADCLAIGSLQNDRASVRNADFTSPAVEIYDDSALNHLAAIAAAYKSAPTSGVATSIAGNWNQGTTPYVGVTLVIAPAVPLVTGAAALTGAGSLTADGTVTAGPVTGAAALTGAGALTADGVVTAASGPIAADFSGAPTSGVAPLTVAFTDLSAGTPTGWEWDFENDGVPDSTAQNPSHVYGLPGTYAVKLRANKPGSFDIETKTAYVTVTPAAGTPPTAAFSSIPDPGGPPIGVSFFDESTDSPTAWDWDFGDGSPIVHLQNPWHEYATAGDYTVTLTVHNASGSDSTSAELPVTVIDPDAALAGVNVAFEASMLEPFPAWTRLDSVPSLVAEYSIRRGRQDEFEHTGTGTASIRLNDTDGLFDPTNPSSPYLGIMDGRQVGIGLFNPCAGTWHTIFRGILDEYAYDVHPSGVVTYVEMDAVDALDYLANVEIAPGVVTSSGGAHGHDPDDADPPYPLAEGDVYYLPQTVDDRIHKLLGDAEFPEGLRTIFTGNVYVKEQVVSAGTPVLALLGDAADAEFPGVANLYVSRTGKVTFHGRLARFDPDTTSGEAGDAWTFTRWKAGDGSATPDTSYAQLRGLSFARQRKLIINAALAYPFRDPTVEEDITAAQMEAQAVTDPTSIEIYGVRSWSAESLMTFGHVGAGPDPTNTDLEETKLFAEHYVANYAQPQTRLTQLVFRSLHPDDPRAPATWALICGVEISDTVKVKTNHAGAGGFADDEFYVEGITYEVRPLNGVWQDVTLTLDVSPVAYYTSGPFAT